MYVFFNILNRNNKDNILSSDGSLCPRDGTAMCVTNGTKAQVTIVRTLFCSNALTIIYPIQIELYISDVRGCIGAQSRSCTRENPCDPCFRDELEVIQKTSIAELFSLWETRYGVEDVALALQISW